MNFYPLPLQTFDADGEIPLQVNEAETYGACPKKLLKVK
jgi:hypothetical protein